MAYGDMDHMAKDILVFNIVTKFHKILIKNYSTKRLHVHGVTYGPSLGVTLNAPSIVMAGAYPLKKTIINRILYFKYSLT